MKRRTTFICTGIALAVAACFGGVYRFLKEPKFGSVPSSTESFSHCAHFYDGVFHNTLPTPVLTDNSSFVEAFAKSFFAEKIDTEPVAPLPTVKVDLKTLPRQRDLIIWLGHSSFYLQLSGKRILIDPVLSDYASPVSFSTKAFRGTNPYKATDFPDIDCLIISHDHWDHLDFPTVTALKTTIKNVVCPVGVDAHFLRWGFSSAQLHPLDWGDCFPISDSLKIYALEARHYSGRTLDQNKSFWAGFLLRSPQYRIFFSGDSGYSPHFKDISKRFGPIDLVLLDSGQYNDRWRYIHMNPDESLQAAKDLRAQNLLPAHIGKFCISTHPWYEPFERLSLNADKAGINLVTPQIGQPIELVKHLPKQAAWWRPSMYTQRNSRLKQKT